MMKGRRKGDAKGGSQVDFGKFGLQAFGSRLYDRAAD